MSTGYNSLNSLLTSIANAIRTKKGSSSLINAQDFPSEILNLPGGSAYTYYLKTYSDNGNDASMRICLIQDGVVLSDQVYLYYNLSSWTTFGNIKIKYENNWIVACNSGTVRNVDNKTNYTSDQTMGTWSYRDRVVFTFSDVVS